MTRFHTRSDLIHYAMKRAPSSACRRAFETGTVEVLGGFYPLVPFGKHGGWMLRVTSANSTIWLLAVVVSSSPRSDPYVREADNVPWRYWFGRVNRDTYDINDGDNPTEASRLRGATDADARTPGPD